jgi:uncharacterized protein YjbI with pentapeptide repeats
MRRVWNKLFNSTGFQGKTLWDWMSFLIVPFVIVAAIAGLSYFESDRENKHAEALRVAEVKRADTLRKADIERADALLEAENRRAQAQQEIETDRARQSVLQSYIQDMTTLLLDEGLAVSKPDSLIVHVARANTSSAIYQLDSGRNRILVRFLFDSNLLGRADPVALLSGTDLSGTDLSGTDLEGAYLRDTDLSRADLSGANLGFASLRGANLSGTNLRDADLRFANLRGANLSGTNLRDANLSRADLNSTDILSGTVTGWTNEQLAQARSLVGATLPDGTVMTEAAWEEFKKSYRQSFQAGG